MQTTGVGVLAQWKRVVTSLGTASDLSLDFTFFPMTFYVRSSQVPMPPGLQRNGLLPPTE